MLAAYRFAVTNGDFRNSDDAANVLAATDLSQGNLRLHGWLLTPENYYPTDLLGQAVLKLLFGFHPLFMQGLETLFWAAVALTGLYLACLRRPRHQWPGTASIALALLALNVFDHGFSEVVLTNIGSHGSTILLTLLTFTVATADGLQPIPRAALLGLFVATGSLSDRIFEVIACLPVLADAVLDTGRRESRRPALVRIAVTVAAVILAHAALALNTATGGFEVLSFPVALATYPEILAHIAFAADGIARLLGADFFGRNLRRPLTSGAAITLLRAPFLLLFLIASWQAGSRLLRQVRRWPRPSGPSANADLERLLWFSMAFCLASTCITTAITDPACVRYFLPAAVTGSILVARSFGRSSLTAAYGALTCAASLAAGLTFASHSRPGRVVAIPQLYHIVDALEAAHLQHGFAGYWEGSIVTVLSKRRITSLPLCEAADGSLQPLRYFTNLDWYRTAARMWQGRVFFISERTSDQSPMVAPEAAVLRQFGHPIQRIDQGQFVINIYDLHRGALAALSPDR